MQERSSTNKGKKFFVAGGNGFVGSHIVRSLVASGAEVYATARPSGMAAKQMDRLQGLGGNIKRIELDLLDERAVGDALAKIMPDVVINSVGTLNGKQTLDSLEEQMNGNFTPSLNLAMAAAKNKVGKFVHIGSSLEYGGAKAPFLESMREQAISPYSLSKIMSTQAVMLCGRLSGMPTTVVRPAAVFGPMQGSGVMLIPNIIKSSMDRKDFNMNPGDQVRDFIYVEDLVRGILMASASPKSDQEIFNLGGNRGYKIKEVVNTLNKLLGNKIRINLGAEPYRPQDTMEFYMDSSKAEKILGWKADTSMETALQRTVDWYNANQ